MDKQKEMFNGEPYLREKLAAWEREPLAFIAFLDKMHPEEMARLAELYRRVNPYGADALARVLSEKRDFERRLSSRIPTAPIGL